MALRGGRLFQWPPFDQGIDHENRTDQTPLNVSPRRLLVAENVFWRQGGLERRLGTSLIHDPNTFVPITGGVRFYRGTTRETWVASGTDLYRYNADHSVRTGAGLSLTADRVVNFTPYRTGATDDTIRVYVANGADTPRTISGNPGTVATFAPTNLPADVVQFISHQDRLFAYSTTNPLQLIWSPSLNPGGVWISAAPAAGRAIYIPSSDPAITAAISHRHTTAEAGVISELVVCTASQTWAVVGTQGWGTDGTGLVNNVGTDIRLHSISGVVGCLATNTMVNIAGLGLIFLGRTFGRNQLFLLAGQGQAAQLLPIAGVRSDLNVIPSRQLQWACATYADGYYMLSYTLEGDTKNRRELWLNVESLFRVKEGLWGAFYGPMRRVGNISGINCYIPFSGGADVNELFVGDSGSGRLYQINTGNLDEGNAIPVTIQTPWTTLGNTHLVKRVARAYIHAERNSSDPTQTIHFDYGSRSLAASVPIIPVSRIGDLVIGTGTIGGQTVGHVALELQNLTDDAGSEVNLDCEAFSQELTFTGADTPFKLHALGVQYQIKAYDMDRVST